MTISEIALKIKRLKSALIISHNRPDGDTIGSALALKTALSYLGINASVACESDIPEKFNFLSGDETFLKPESVNREYDGYIAVDCSVPTMFPKFYEIFTKKKTTFNVDHHVSNSRYAKYNYVCDTGANTENIYDLIVELGVEIDEKIANFLLLGIVTDTGNFAHSNTTSKTLLIASKLVEKKADINKIIYKMFKDQTRERAMLYSKVINKMEYYLDGQVAVITISKKDLQECGANDSMTEGFIDFPLTVRTVEVAFSLLETANNRYKISMRSKGKVNVNEIASIYGGGGHILASGAMMNGYREDIIDKLVYNVKQRIL